MFISKNSIKYLKILFKTLILLLLFVKTIHHVVNITMTETELFTIRCGINQAIHIINVLCIIVFTDAIHLAKKIFDSSLHSYQVQSITIVQDLRDFFKRNSDNSISFWKCPSKTKWKYHVIVDKKTKQFNLKSLFPYKSCWDYSMKEESNDIICKWQITFQVSNFKENHFLNLLNNYYLSIKPTYMKSGLWLNIIDYSNSLCMRVTRTIINHALIGKYWLRFFPKENFNCSYRYYPIESRYHILHECRRFNNYWNLNRNSLSYFIAFLKFNSGAFSFHEGITK